MADRTTESTVTFKRPFTLSAFDHPQPTGTYRLVVDEKEIVGLSFPAYRRSATMLHTPALSVVDGFHQIDPIDFVELATALEEDYRDELNFSKEEIDRELSWRAARHRHPVMRGHNGRSRRL